MRTLLFRAATALTLLAAVASCSLLKKKGAEDAGPSADATAEVVDAAPAPTAPAAANVDDVARFPDEAKLESVAATLLRAATVREAPLTGKPVAQLAKGASVSEIAQRDKYFLVVFDSPKEPGKKLMGWLHQDGFTAVAPVDAGIKPLVCKAPDVALFTDGPFCDHPCTADTDCAPGKACKGSAQKFTGGKLGETVMVCTFFAAPDAGAPKVVVADAGLPSVVDAGKVSIDSGAAPATAGGDVVDPVGGACAAGFKLVPKDNKCHRIAASPAVCGVGAKFWIACDGARVCSATRDLCK